MFSINEQYNHSVIGSIAGNRFYSTWCHVFNVLVPGQSFLVLNHFNEEHTYTFLYEGMNGTEGLYKCVYADYIEYRI